MKTSDHVTRNQIEAFGAGALAASDSRVIGGHLIRCVECRGLLPLPNATRVWTAITSETDFSEAKRDKNPSSAERAFGGAFAGLFGRRNRLAWAGGMLAVVVSLATLLIFSVSSERNVETDVARSFQVENPIPPPNQDFASGIDAGVPSDPKSDSGVKSPNSDRTDRGSVDERRRRAPAIPTDNQPVSRNRRNISATRGAIAPCTLGKTIDVELGSNKTDLVLKWKPVPKAAKYHLYVSDDSEILIDEFETDVATSYVLKKQLDPAKAYKWKIVITLESGQKLYVDAQKFSAKDFQSSLSGYKRKARSNTRCLSNE